MLISKRERELMKKHVKRVGFPKLFLTYLVALVVVIVIEVFASVNLHLIRDVPDGSLILRDVFSIIAIMVAAFTVIANIVFLGGRTKEDREFHYYFRTRPILMYSGSAILGDIVAIFMIHNTSFAYMVFYTALIALNVFAMGFAIHSTERMLKSSI
ncbi:MAG: hypothetical protein V1729_00030 [Candidatus Woesearchaeota archaeon]